MKVTLRRDAAGWRRDGGCRVEHRNAATDPSVDVAAAPAKAIRDVRGETRESKETIAGFDLLVVGAGPAGIALVCEARAVGVSAERIVVLEKSEAHSWVLRRYYPAAKPVLANYKGIEARCEGVLCIADTSREETLSYLDRTICDSGVTVRYREEVFRIRREPDGALLVGSTGGGLRARVVVIAIGILGRPNKPSYSIPLEVRHRVFSDVTSEEIRGRQVLVVGGGDTAAEYCQYLVQQDNQVTLSYRGTELTRPNPINRDSVLALERQEKLHILWASNIAGLDPDGDRIRVRFGEPHLAPLSFDRVVHALGGTTPEAFLKAVGIEFDGPAPRLRPGFGTIVPGLYLAGDLTAGKKGGSINLAFNSSAAAMRRICADHGICTAALRRDYPSRPEDPAPD